MTLLRLVAVAVAAFLLSCTAPAFAQSAPAAAPPGSPAQSRDLGAPDSAPTSSVDVSPLGVDANASIGSISVVHMFMSADWIVKSVMIVLLVASLWSWTIIINKWLALGTLGRRAAKFEKIFWSGQSLDELYSKFSANADHPMSAVFVSALREWRRAFEGGVPREALLPGIKERIDKAMNVTIMREADGLERSLGFLATVGSTAPFIGLFGTVWGIMNSFSAIAARHDTTLAVVAPGIAEALFATAMGLLAAIPAVIFYNRFVNEIGRYSTRLDAFADELSAILSRQLDEKAR
ncbi:MAG TPA: protein TolQ [Rhizomicrobium sp.]|nr:protein TolQ [Rhizomicrobium sp.]